MACELARIARSVHIATRRGGRFIVIFGEFKTGVADLWILKFL